MYIHVCVCGQLAICQGCQIGFIVAQWSIQQFSHPHAHIHTHMPRCMYACTILNAAAPPLAFDRILCSFALLLFHEISNFYSNRFIWKPLRCAHLNQFFQPYIHTHVRKSMRVCAFHLLSLALSAFVPLALSMFTHIHTHIYLILYGCALCCKCFCVTICFYCTIHSHLLSIPNVCMFIVIRYYVNLITVGTVFFAWF